MLENGLDLAVIDGYNFGRLYRWERHGFRHYSIQALRGLAEGPTGPIYRRRKGIAYIHRYYLNRMVNSDYMDNGTHYPEHFLQAKVQLNEDESLRSAVYWPKCDDKHFAKTLTLHRQFLVYLCPVCEYICPAPENAKGYTFIVRGPA